MFVAGVLIVLTNSLGLWPGSRVAGLLPIISNRMEPHLILRLLGSSPIDHDLSWDPIAPLPYGSGPRTATKSASARTGIDMAAMFSDSMTNVDGKWETGEVQLSLHSDSEC